MTSRKAAPLGALVVICCILILPFSHLHALAQQQGDTNKDRSADSRGGATSQATLDRATGLALQGDAATAVRALLAVPASAFQGEQASFRGCMIGRFGPDPTPIAMVETKDPWIDSLITSYRKYWQRALTRPAERVEAEIALRQDVASLLSMTRLSDEDLDKAEDKIKARAKRAGFHMLLGRTQPLRELMVWRKLTVKQQRVQLPEGMHAVKVRYLDDFVVRGWGHYATCGRRSAGGWATEDGLFAVVPAYKSLSDETFSIRFLAHETQHFADKQKYKHLEGWELEYRAKLVELIMSDATQDSTLELFCENRSPQKDSAHAYANFRVVQDVSEELNLAHGTDICTPGSPRGQALRDAARVALRKDSSRRNSQSTSIRPLRLSVCPSLIDLACGAMRPVTTRQNTKGAQ